jgi:hypothetical protein
VLINGEYVCLGYLAVCLTVCLLPAGGVSGGSQGGREGAWWWCCCRVRVTSWSLGE